MKRSALTTIADVLQHAGWLTADFDYSPHVRPAADLLPLIQAKVANQPEHSNKRSKNVSQWIEAARLRGAQLLVWPLHGFDGTDESTRLLWCPHGLKPLRRIAVLSSHLGQRADQLREWFQLLRQVVQERSTAEQLIIARGTTAYPWLECVAKDAGARTLLLECPNTTVEKRGLLKWLNELVRADRSNDSALLSPALQSNLQQVTEPRLLGDQGLLQLADEVFVLRLLKRGRLRRVLDQHLLSHSQQTAIHIAVGERLVPSDLAPSLVERGCRIWPHVASPGPPRQLRLRTPVVNHSSDSPASTVMLTHWTRAASGPWPDQTVDQFRREIVFDRAAAERGPLATLLRILAMRRLCASRQAIRGSYPVVCFTAVPFDELTRHLVYRRHRGRWDFCPYGISISREWLLARGARPVIYGEAATWEQLDDDDRPYFQSNDLRPSSQPTNACQWSTEREWRIVGDVDLSDLPADKAWIFVPTPIEARWASFLSRWPVRLADPTAPAPSLPRESM